jgi:hypothetical protein
MLEDLCEQSTGFSEKLLRETRHLLDRVPHRLRVQNASYEDGRVHLTVHAPELAAEVSSGDYIYGGFALAHDPAGETEAVVRIFRVACQNGLLADEAEGRRLTFLSARPPLRWRTRLAHVVGQAFEGGCLDEDAQLLRQTLREMLTTPYEFLLHLRAQGLISDEEQVQIQSAFDRAGDATIYGLVNAVTSVAHLHAQRHDWRRAHEIERLGGELSRGDHQPPACVPVAT